MDRIADLLHLGLSAVAVALKKMLIRCNSLWHLCVSPVLAASG